MRLLARCRSGTRARWLLVDEAAALLLPLLRQLMGYFSHVLLTATVAGYEGTGRGFLLKFCEGLPRWHPLIFDEPLRWAAKDPLERWLAKTLLLEDADAPGRSQGKGTLCAAENGAGEPRRCIGRVEALTWRRPPAARQVFLSSTNPRPLPRIPH